MPSAVDTYQRYRRALAGRNLPAAYVDVDLLDDNISAVARRAGRTPVRVASKSVRSVAVLRRLVGRLAATDAGCAGLLCIRPAEAVLLAGRGFDDLLVAYPAVDADELDATAAAVADGASITLMADSVEHIQAAAAAGRRHGADVPLCLDVDCSVDFPGLRFGVWRSPVRTPAAAVTFADRVAATEGVRLDGVMGYEAQIAGLPDRAPGAGLQAPVIRRLKQLSVPLVARRRAAIVAALGAAGHALRVVNAGGTGSIETSVGEAVVTEVTAGSGFYAPALFDHYDAFQHVPAAGYAVEVTRRPTGGMVTCAGGGYPASGVAGPDKAPVVHLPPGASLTSTEGAGEVQTPVRLDGSVDVDLGDPVLLRHAKAGELCERFNELLLIGGERVLEVVPTYRGEGWCFL